MQSHSLDGKAVELEALTKYYGSIRALDGVSFSVPYGSIFGYLGPNGSGKSTTLKIIVGLLRKYRGRARVLDGEPWDPRVRREVGYMPELPRLPPFMKALDFLVFVGRLRGLDRDSSEEEAKASLDSLGLSELGDRRIGKLSKGTLQRLALAQAILGRPRLLILDEPSLGMDPESRVELRRLFLELNSSGSTILLSSHLLEEVERLCTHIGILYKGRLIAQGEADSIRGFFRDSWYIEAQVLGDLDRVVESLRSLECVGEVERHENSLRISLVEKADYRERVSKTIQQAGGVIIGISLNKESLEEAYLKAVGGEGG